MKDETHEKLRAQCRNWMKKHDFSTYWAPELAEFVESAVQSARNEALEAAAVEVEIVYIYTAPGGYDPEQIQKILAKRVRALKTDGTQLT